MKLLYYRVLIWFVYKWRWITRIRPKRFPLLEINARRRDTIRRELAFNDIRLIGELWCPYERHIGFCSPRCAAFRLRRDMVCVCRVGGFSIGRLDNVQI